MSSSAPKETHRRRSNRIKHHICQLKVFLKILYTAFKCYNFSDGTNKKKNLSVCTCTSTFMQKSSCVY